MTLRIGTLGAANITPRALIEPAREIDGVEVVSVAARDRQRAEAFAKEHGIPRVLDSYADVIADPEIDALYNPLPIGLHCEWTIRALEAGKDVLCEKALANNAEEARRMARAAAATGRRLVEAFHYRYHPLMARVLELVPRLGTLQRIDAGFSIPFRDRKPGEIRLDLSVGGGATMDLGCYPIHMVRSVSGEEPEVAHAEARTGPKDVDIEMKAELHFPSGATASVSCEMTPEASFESRLEIRGSEGELRVGNPLVPHFGHEFTWQMGGQEHEESFERTTTYLHQLLAFRAHVEEGAPVWTGPDDAICNMELIDAIYRAAGLPVRGA